MAILTGKQIVECVNNGEIEIDPFDISRVNPNSYNMRIGNKLKTYLNNLSDDYKPDGYGRDIILDTKKKNDIYNITIPEEGYVLIPGILYLGETIERTYSKKYAAIIDGRSSGGRLGIQVHMTAGFGDVGFNGIWTLEITVVHPVRIYPGDELCQVYFETVFGDYSYQYNGRYQNQKEVTGSRIEEVKRGLITDYE